MEHRLYLMGLAPRPYDTSKPRLSLDEWGKMSQGWERVWGRACEHRKIFGLNIGQGI